MQALELAHITLDYGRRRVLYDLSFEVLIRKANLTSDPALVLMGQIVGTADVKQSPHNHPAGVGLRAVCDGLSWRYPDDDERILREGLVVYDAMYTWCQRKVGGIV